MERRGESDVGIQIERVINRKIYRNIGMITQRQEDREGWIQIQRGRYRGLQIERKRRIDRKRYINIWMIPQSRGSQRGEERDRRIQRGGYRYREEDIKECRQRQRRINRQKDIQKYRDDNVEQRQTEMGGYRQRGKVDIE